MSPTRVPVLPDPMEQLHSTSSESGAPVAARHPIIYNLFPTLAGRAPRWIEHAERARSMGFGWIYVNSVLYPGFSGSLYAIKHHDRLHPLLAPEETRSGLDALAPTIRSIRNLGLSVMVDLVINHTAKDCPLVATRPGWFRRDAQGELLSPFAIDPANADHVTVWGDLAEIDNGGAADRDELWQFWERLLFQLMDVGFTGFRCDAAYKVPAALWERLIGRAKAREPATLFVAETLGARLEEIDALGYVGFDYFYNSSKWWDFDQPWCLAQHERLRDVVPSISFPESHDTPRLAAETSAHEPVQRQRYAFAAAFSEGVQLTIGYEFGFRRPLDVVTTRPSDWEEPAFDLVPFVAHINALKRRHPLLRPEGVLSRIATSDNDVAVIRRWSDQTGVHRGVIAINRNTVEPRTIVLPREDLPPDPRVYRLCREDAAVEAVPSDGVLPLAPAEVVMIAEAL
jgi:starch synthase (maltosyl-transferring)